MSEAKYKVGEMVTVLNGRAIESKCTFNDFMDKYVGESHEIIYSSITSYGFGYRLKDCDRWWFDEKWLVPTLIDPTPFLNGVPTFSFNTYPVPDRIIRNEDATVVMWKDGTKTIVHKAEGTEDSPYAAFTAALAIKCYGSNSAVNRIVRKTERQKSKKEKAEEKKRKKTLSQLAEEVTVKLVQMKCENCKYIDKACATEYKKGEAYFCEHKGKYVFPDKYCTDFEPEML